MYCWYFSDWLTVTLHFNSFSLILSTPSLSHSSTSSTEKSHFRPLLLFFVLFFFSSSCLFCLLLSARVFVTLQHFNFLPSIQSTLSNVIPFLPLLSLRIVYDREKRNRERGWERKSEKDIVFVDKWLLTEQNRQRDMYHVTKSSIQIFHPLFLPLLSLLSLSLLSLSPLSFFIYLILKLKLFSIPFDWNWLGLNEQTGRESKTERERERK